MRIRQKIFVVTGGLSGLGLATTKRLAASGAYVAAIDIKDADSVALDAKVKVFKVNVTIPDQVTSAIDQVVAWSVDTGMMIGGMICCAGILGPAKLLTKNGTPMTIENFKNVVDVSLIGTIDAVRQLAPHMAAQKGEGDDNERGIIILVSSAAAFDGQPGQVAYSAAKGALASLTLPLARDLAVHHIRAMCIAPGMFDTSMVASMPSKALESLRKVFEFPMRAGRAEEFAGLVEHIIGNVMLNGSVIRLDGATRMPSRL